MNQPHLHKLLAELHDELLKARSVDANDQDLLRHLSGDIRALLDRQGTGRTGAQGELRRRLVEAVGRFEASHPDLAKALANAIDTLAFYNL